MMIMTIPEHSHGDENAHVDELSGLSDSGTEHL